MHASLPRPEAENNCYVPAPPCNHLQVARMTCLGINAGVNKVDCTLKRASAPKRRMAASSSLPYILPGLDTWASVTVRSARVHTLDDQVVDHHLVLGPLDDVLLHRLLRHQPVAAAQDVSKHNHDDDAEQRL